MSREANRRRPMPTEQERRLSLLSTKGACAGAPDPDAFTPDGDGPETENLVWAVRTYCGRCPVLGECREFALAETRLSGIWGGTTTEMRRKHRRDSALATRRAKYHQDKAGAAA